MIGDAFEGFDDLPGQIQDDVDRAVERANGSQELRDCIRRAVDQTPPDTQRVNRCVERFSP